MILYTGDCVTTAYPGEVCGFNSYAVGCDGYNLSATACRCYQDDLYNTDTDILTTEPENSTCEG